MGCDIHSFVEVRQSDGTWRPIGDVFPLGEFDRKWHKKDFGSSPFDVRNYGMFGFLAGVRNYSCVPVIAEPKYAIPDDANELIKKAYEDWSGDAHTATWLTLRQLLEVDYEQQIWDRRVTKQVRPNVWDGAALASEGEGTHESLREFLGDHFFRDLEVLKTLGKPDDVRIVFWFDN
jgi:hypothetical protein